MKRFFTLISLAALAVFATGCTQDSPDTPKVTSKAKATYTLKMAMTGVTATSSVHYDLMAFEYSDAGEKTGNHTITLATSGKSETYTANDHSVKVKLYYRMYSDKSSYTEYKWVQKVFYLEKGSNTVVALEDSSLVGNKEP